MGEEIGNEKCYFCDKEVTSDDFCYGCKHYVCKDCEETLIIGHGHLVDEHKARRAEGSLAGGR